MPWEAELISHVYCCFCFNIIILSWLSHEPMQPKWLDICRSRVEKAFGKKIFNIRYGNLTNHHISISCNLFGSSLFFWSIYCNIRHEKPEKVSDYLIFPLPKLRNEFLLQTFIDRWYTTMAVLIISKKVQKRNHVNGVFYAQSFLCIWTRKLQ